MTAEIIELNAAKIKELQDQKIIGKYDDDVELEPVSGLRVLGELSVHEVHLFTEILNADATLQDSGRELQARITENVSMAIRESEVPDDIAGKLEHYRLFNDDEEAENYFYELQRLDYLRAMFWFSVRERVQTYAHRLSIRAGFKICDVGPKYLK